MNKLLCNRIRTPDGTILESLHRHDYRTYVDKNGLEYMVDGGLDYARRNVHNEHPYEELSVYSDDPHEVIRQAFKWGTRGVDGKQPIKFIPLQELTDDHIEAILDTQTHISTTIRQVFVNEVAFRKAIQ